VLHEISISLREIDIVPEIQQLIGKQLLLSRSFSHYLKTNNNCSVDSTITWREIAIVSEFQQIFEKN